MTAPVLTLGELAQRYEQRAAIPSRRAVTLRHAAEGVRAILAHVATVEDVAA